MESPPQTPRRGGKRQTRDDDGYEDTQGSSSQGSPQKRKKSRTGLQSPPPTPSKAKRKALVWQGIPKWKDDRCPFLDLPVEILDKITSASSGLELCDYVALSGVNQMIRGLFTAKVWEALLANQIYCGFSRATYGFDSTVDRIWSTGWLARAKNPFPGAFHKDVGACPERDAILHSIDLKSASCNLIVMSDAKKKYKLTAVGLKTLKHRRSPNSHHHSAPEMWLFPEAAVYRLALMSHGGPSGHEAYLKKVAETAAKTKATKEANGTTPKKGPRGSQAPVPNISVIYVGAD